jgi:hypothetical protein
LLLAGANRLRMHRDCIFLSLSWRVSVCSQMLNRAARILHGRHSH